jgi:hypothetical protein
VIPAGEDQIGRKTKLSVLSISPLDRLLNQMNNEDNIRVEISCYPRIEGMHPGESRNGENWDKVGAKFYDFKSNYMHVNTENCYHGRPGDKT